MKISDRDKKLIMVVLLAAIIALPIFLFIKPKNDQIKQMKEELVDVDKRYDYLKDLSLKQPEYEAKIVELNTSRDEMIKGFAGGVLTENTIMFLRDVEKSEDHDVRSLVIAFAEDEETQITEASVNASTGEYVEPLTAIKSSVTVDYCGDYKDVVRFINYIFTYKDKMNLSAFSMDLDQETNLIGGTFVLDQYAVSGNGKEVKQATIPGMLHGEDRLFDLILDEEGNVKDYWSSLGVKEFGVAGEVTGQDDEEPEEGEDL